MAKSASNLFSPSAYAVWTAPLGTTVPLTVPTTPGTSPGAGWYEVGVLSDQGITEDRNVNETKIFDLIGQLQRIIRNQEERPITFEALEDNRVVRELRYPGSTVSSTSGTPEVQTVTITGVPTGGTFTLRGGSGGVATTSALAFNAASAAVQTAVQALPGFSAVTVTGSAGGPFTVTFPAALGNVDALIADATGLTGGTTPGVTVATTTPGVPPTNTRPVGSGTGQNRRCWLVYAADGVKAKGFALGNGEAVHTGTVGITGNGVSVAQFTLNPYPDSNQNFFTLIDNDSAQSVAYS